MTPMEQVVLLSACLESTTGSKRFSYFSRDHLDEIYPKRNRKNN